MNGSSSALSLVCGFNASTGQAVAQAPQSTQAFGSTYSISAVANPGSPGAGWMQLTGQASTHDASAQHDWVTTYGTCSDRLAESRLAAEPRRAPVDAHQLPHATGHRVHQTDLLGQTAHVGEESAHHLLGLRA